MIPLPFGLSMGKALIYLGLAAAIAIVLWRLHAAIYGAGYEAGAQLLKDYIAGQGAVTRTVEREVEKIVKETEVVYVDRIKEVRVRGEQLVVKVPVYVTKSDDAACELRGGFVRVHDSAASGAGPAGTSGESPSDREPSGVALSEAAAVIAENYTTCRVWRKQVEGWDEFWTRYSAAVKSAVCVVR